MTFSKASDFSVKDIEQDLTRLITSDVTAGILPQTENKLAMGAASALIKYLGVWATTIPAIQKRKTDFFHSSCLTTITLDSTGFISMI